MNLVPAPEQFVPWFRAAAPYIHAFRGRTFVVAFGGEVVADGKFVGLTHDFNLLASLIENCGPFLTPARMQAAAPAMGARGGGNTGYELRRFTQGSYGWTADTRIIYFNKHQASPYNSKSGKYIQIEGTRFDSGQFPTMKEPPAPPAEGRS